MRILSFFMLLFISAASTSCELADMEESLDGSLNRKFSIHSVEKNATYPIWVQLPDDYFSNNESYATVYVLDADDNQEYVAQRCRAISASMGIKNVIVVGIGYGDDRENDYTPTPTDMGDGEALKFLAFIKNELIPHMESEFRVDPSRNGRAIIGHSFGGLCGAYAFTDHNEVFGNYLLLSASLFYDNDVVMIHEQNVRNQIKDNEQLVYIGAGGTEGPLLVDNDLLHRRLNAHYPNTISTFKLIEGKGHNASKNPNINKALNFYFQNRQ